MRHQWTLFSAWISSMVGLLGGAGLGLWAWNRGMGTDAVFPSIIIGVWLGGGAWSLYNVTRMWRAGLGLSPEKRPGNWRSRSKTAESTDGVGVFRPLWLLYNQHPRATKDMVHECIDACVSRFSLRGLRYASGSLIFLGLVGTLYGLSHALGGLSLGINALVTEGDSALFLHHLKQQLQHPLEGMALAFTSSLMGVAGTLTMGFFVWQWERARDALQAQADQWAHAMFQWRPEGATWWGGDISQETLTTWLSGVDRLAVLYAQAEKRHEALITGLTGLAQHLARMTSVTEAQYQEQKDWHQDQLLTRQILEHIQRQLQTLNREKNWIKPDNNA